MEPRLRHRLYTNQLNDTSFYVVAAVICRFWIFYRGIEKLDSSRETAEILTAHIIDAVLRHHHATHSEHAAVLRVVGHRSGRQKSPLGIGIGKALSVTISARNVITSDRHGVDYRVCVSRVVLLSACLIFAEKKLDVKTSWVQNLNTIYRRVGIQTSHRMTPADNSYTIDSGNDRADFTFVFYGSVHTGRCGLRRLATLEFTQPPRSFPRVPFVETAGRAFGRATHSATTEILQHLVVKHVAPEQSTPHRRSGHIQDKRYTGRSD